MGLAKFFVAPKLAFRGRMDPDSYFQGQQS